MSSKSDKNKFEMPVILYEDTKDNAYSFPYMEIQKDKVMPPVLFLFEYKHTGETEPNESGEEVPVIDQIPHKFVDMEHLKEVLDPETNDKVRVAVGLKPLKEAQALGKPVIEKVLSKVSSLRKDAKEKGEETKKEFTLNKSKKGS